MQIRKDVVKIKLMGSKSRIAKYIVPIIQKCIDDNNLETYIESCVGGVISLTRLGVRTA